MKKELTANLAQLQNMIKRDKLSYYEEFKTQYKHLSSMIDIFVMKPDAEVDGFVELIMFIASVSVCYPQDTKDYPKKLMDLLKGYHQQMNGMTRQKIAQALILMRNRDLVDQLALLTLFFTLFSCNDKTLRAMLHTHIVNDIKRSNQKAKNNKLNKTLQNFMYKMVSNNNELVAKKSLEVMIELYHKNIWNDAKTVNVISEACLSQTPKIVTPAVHFFLGANEDKYKEESDDDEVPDLSNLQHKNSINKKRKSRQSQLEKAKAVVKRKERQKNRVEQFNFSALHLINDPQEFTDRLFSNLRLATAKNLFRFDLRINMMNLISRLIHTHKLLTLGFYDFVLSYLKPHQQSVSQILTFVAQSCHELIPPDLLETVIKTIANNFIWTNCANEVLIVGFNTIYEICKRNHLAMPMELLQSLLDDYKAYSKDRGVMSASRSLLGLYRQVNPEMLKKKDRGKVATIALMKDTVKTRKYGEVEVNEDVDGADLLELKSDEEIGSDESEGEVPDLVPAEATIAEVELENEREGDEYESGSDKEGDEFDGDELEWEVGSEELSSDDEQEEIEGELLESGDEQEEIEGEVLESGDEVEQEVSEEEKQSPKKKQKLEPKQPKVSLATQKIFTDEDFAKIRERREQREIERLAGINSSKKVSNESDDEEFIDVSKIMAHTKKKNDYEARLQSIKEGREGREKYGSRKGKDTRSSTTNREKSKSKLMTMMVHKRAIKGKKSRSLREKQKVLRAHITKQKKKGH